MIRGIWDPGMSKNWFQIRSQNTLLGETHTYSFDIILTHRFVATKKNDRLAEEPLQIVSIWKEPTYTLLDEFEQHDWMLYNILCLFEGSTFQSMSFDVIGIGSYSIETNGTYLRKFNPLMYKKK